MKTALEDLRDAVAQLLGATARVELTISGGAIVPPDGSGGGVFTVDTEGNAATDDLTSITTTNTWSGMLVRLYAENTARVVTIKHGTGNITLADSTDFALDAAGTWVELQLVGSTWVETQRNYATVGASWRSYLGVPREVSQGVLCPHERLRVDYASASTVTIAADAVLLTDTSGNQRRFTSVSETLTISSTGAGGREVAENGGAEKASDWYHIWLIAKTDGTVDAFATLAYFPGGSSIYSVLPSGYTYAGYVGAAYNNGSSNFTDFWQRDDVVHFGPTQVLTSGTQTTRTSVSLSAAVPDTHGRVSLNASVTPASSGTAATAVISPDASSGTAEVSLQAQPVNAGASFMVGDLLPRTVQSIGYRVSSGDTLDLFVTGWEY